MKKTIIMLCLALVSWGANAQHDHSKMSHSENKNSEMMDNSSLSSSIKVGFSRSVTSIVDNYLALKNALIEDNSKKAADSGKMLYQAIVNFNSPEQSESQKNEIKDILEDAKEHAEHISENRNDIGHQREHFEILSKDIKDLVLITGADRTLYQIFCPMYNKGAIWLSESNEIRNPFFGSKMMKCGEVQQKITVK
ncbi:MAG: DUF3347 domain-containing protein [Salinivirgaceae bacterium]